MWNSKGTRELKTIWKKKNEAGGMILPNNSIPIVLLIGIAVKAV